MDGMEQLTYLLTTHGVGSLLKSGTSVVCSSSTRTLWNLLLNDGSVDYVHNVFLVGVHNLTAPIGSSSAQWFNGKIRLPVVVVCFFNTSLSTPLIFNRVFQDGSTFVLNIL